MVKVIEEGYFFVEEVERVPRFDCKNYKSFEEAAEEVDEVLKEEVEAGWIVPWEGAELPRGISARGAIPKADSKEKRLIHDLSRPRGAAINDFVEIKHFRMDTVDLVAGWMTPGCYFFKVDIRHTYRNIPIHPENWELLAFRWNGEVWGHKVGVRIGNSSGDLDTIFGSGGVDVEEGRNGPLGSIY